MPDHAKIFTYEVDGLAYTVTVYEDAGTFMADITVIEGSMDVNAVYFGDDDFSGQSESLGGPLNMNGARLGADKVQWDDAVGLSDPGLGPNADDKETYLSAGETLTVGLDIDSLDEVDVFGIRATSTTTDAGSIKAVSDEPEEREEPEDPTFEKVGFAVDLGENGGIEDGIFMLEGDLPDGEDGTFENYVNLYESEYGGDPDYNITQVESVVFYELVEETDADGNPIEIPQELFRIDAPDGGFTDADALLAAYDAAIADGALDDASTGADGGPDLMAALALDSGFEAETPPEDVETEEEFELL